MRKKVLRLISLLTLLAITAAASAVSLVQQRGDARSPNVSQTRRKNLRDIARERDVEVEHVSEPHSGYTTLESLKKEAAAIVYGRIIDSKSFFDESGHPMEHGELITTEYTVEVLRVLKDTTLDTAYEPGRAAAAPLSTPLKIARNGGVVHLNGHRAEVKVKGYEALHPGRQYVFFLSWSPDYKAYLLVGGINGAVMVNDDGSLKPLGSSKEIQSELRGMDLESFINRVK